MRKAMAWAVGAITVVHGAIHLLGAAKGFGWAEITQLGKPISVAMGAAWLAAAALLIAVGILMPARVTGWWVAAGAAALVSQAVIVTSWADAKAGTAVNVLLVVAAVWGLLADGPPSLRAEYRRLADKTLAAALVGGHAGAGLVTEQDLTAVPPPVAAYVRASGAVGQPRVAGFSASFSGRIRSGPDAPWMEFTGTQVNTYGVEPSRVFLLDATMKGIPADVLHAYVGAEARMEVRAASVIKMVDVGGPEMTRAETVTLLNDLCVFAPAALADAPIEWAAIDDHHARATYSNAGHTVSAILVFDDSHQLVDFVSDDRLASSKDGRTFTPRRWSTPIGEYRNFAERRIGAAGACRWHPTDAPSFDYLEVRVDDITYLETDQGRQDR